MRRRHRFLAAASQLALAACSQPAPATHRGSTTTSATPRAESGPDATVAPATTSTEPVTESAAAGSSPAAAGPTTTAYIITVPTTPPTTITVRPRPLPTTILPENRDEALTDAEWVGACGGSLPPCSVMRAESGGDPTAVNATGCGGRGCYGKWQFDPRTSRGLGYPLTMDQYPESVQDDAARALWAGGRGCSHWDAC